MMKYGTLNKGSPIKHESSDEANKKTKLDFADEPIFERYFGRFIILLGFSGATSYAYL